MSYRKRTSVDTDAVEETRRHWQHAFDEALEHDSWGQVEEATDAYKALEQSVTEEYDENFLALPRERRDVLGLFALAIRNRIKELQADDRIADGLDDVRALKPFVQKFLISDVEFPLKGLVPPQRAPTVDPVMLSQRLGDYGEGSLLPPPRGLGWGDVSVSVRIDKWGFKDPDNYYKPCVVVSLVDANGNYVESSQETPLAFGIDGSHIQFDQTVHIQTPLNKFEDGYALFFEFMHWKEKKTRHSVKAYCFMEIDEIKAGEAVLEAYKKPADFARKRRPRLLSVKPLFLHLFLTLRNH